MSEFQYYNNTPDGAIEENCVSRAITLASGLPYRTVAKLLDLASEHTGHNRISIDSYGYLLEEVLGYPVYYPRKGETVGELVDRFPHNTLLIRLDGHLLASVAGIVYDLFESDYRTDITCFWIAK